MAHDDGQHGESSQVIISGKMTGKPDGAGPFGKIYKQSQHESRCPQKPSNIPGSSVTAAQFPYVLPQTKANEIITGGEAAKDVTTQANDNKVARRRRRPKY